MQILQGSKSFDSDYLSSPNVESASKGEMDVGDRPPAAVNGTWGPCNFWFGFSGYSKPKTNITGSTPIKIYQHFLTDEIF